MVLAEDLAHATNAARAAIEPTIQKLEEGGVAVNALRPCDAEARDGTRLGGCVKHYIPQPDGQWGAVCAELPRSERGGLSRFTPPAV